MPPWRLGTGPFFGRKTCFARKSPAENMDLSPSAPRLLPTPRAARMNRVVEGAAHANVAGDSPAGGRTMSSNLASEGETPAAVLSRRGFIAGATLAALAATRPKTARALSTPSTTYRAAVIGHTGRGNYGHGLDRVWLDVPGVELVAVADAEPAGLTAAAKRLGVSQAYADYREMLDRVKPDLVSVCAAMARRASRMVLAAAERACAASISRSPCARPSPRPTRWSPPANATRQVGHRLPDPLQPETAGRRRDDPRGQARADSGNPRSRQGRRPRRRRRSLGAWAPT